jgi:VWFA-related protein
MIANMKPSLLPLLLASLLQTPQPETVIRTTTRLVQIDVVVHDRKGNAVTDLTKDDFVLTDQGQEQPIRLFAVEIEKRDTPPLPPQLPPEGVFSNRLASPDPSRPLERPANLTVVLVDGLNTGLFDQHFMRKAVDQVLAKIHPGDPVALYSLNNGLRVLHDFTSQPPEVLEALQRFQAENSQALAASTPNTDILPPTMPHADPLMAEMMRNVEAGTERFFVDHRVETTVAAFETIGDHLQGMPGRKSLVWISGSFPFSFDFAGGRMAGKNYANYAEQVARVVREFNRAGIAIYPVDARGLIGMFDRYPTFSASSQGSRPGTKRLDTSTRDSITSTQATMLNLAKKTGGKAFMETNDLAGAIQAAMDDARTTYILSFSPTHNQWNGEFREVKVHVKRPGLEVRHRLGYLALADPSTDINQRQRAIVEAGNIPLLSTGLTLQAWTAPATEESNPLLNQWQLAFSMDPSEVSFSPNEKGEWTAVVDFLVLVRDAQGSALHTTSRTMRKALTDSAYQALRKNGLQLSFNLPRAFVPTVVRLVARDANTGLIGSVDVPVN